MEHAKQFHGEGTSQLDEMTLELYNKSNFGTIHITLQNRQNLAGWRVRNSAKMVSTIYDDQAVRQVLGESIPKPVLDWLIDNDALFRLSTMVGAVVVILVSREFFQFTLTASLATSRTFLLLWS